MNPVRKITGYDKRTEVLSCEFKVPQHRFGELRDLAQVDPEDHEALGSYPLKEAAALIVAAKLSLPVKIERCDWFLEAFSEPEASPC